jgi:hypothetical protein
MADGKVEAGGTYYAISHAYYHFVFEVVEMLGPNRARVKNRRQIVSSRLDWTQFFAQGYTRDNTTFHVWPDGEVSWFDISEWNHPIV